MFTSNDSTVGNEKKSKLGWCRDGEGVRFGYDSSMVVAGRGVIKLHPPDTLSSSAMYAIEVTQAAVVQLSSRGRNGE